MNSFQEFLNVYASLLGQGIADTLAMLLISTFFAYIIGLFLGIVLYVTEPTGLRPHKALNAVLGWIINMGRSIPFIILLVAVMPMTRTLVGTTTGVRGVIPPLVLSTAPFVARMVQQSLAEIPKDAIEAAESCGASVPASSSLRFCLKPCLRLSVASRSPSSRLSATRRLQEQSAQAASAISQSATATTATKMRSCSSPSSS